MARSKNPVDGIAATIDKFSKTLEDRFGKLIDTVFSPAKLTGSISKFATTFQSGLSSALDKVASGALMPLSGAIAAFTAGVSPHIQRIARFVEKANPAVAFAFDRALDDLAGTMGQVLVPILQAVTGFYREMADVLQGMKPIIAPTIQVFESLIGVLTKLIAPLTGLFIPALEILNVVITNTVIPAIDLLSSALEGMVDVFNTVTLGIFEVAKKSSVGAAVRSAAYGGIEDIGKRTTLSAIQGATADHQKQMVDEQKKTNGILSNILITTAAKNATKFFRDEANALRRDREAGIGPMAQLENAFRY